MSLSANCDIAYCFDIPSNLDIEYGPENISCSYAHKYLPRLKRTSLRYVALINALNTKWDSVYISCNLAQKRLPRLKHTSLLHMGLIKALKSYTTEIIKKFDFDA